MEHCPSEGKNKCSPSQEMLRILWKSKVLYRVHDGQVWVPLLNQI